jgi:hypothetical protein
MNANTAPRGWTRLGLSRLSKFPDQRHHHPMILELLVEFIAEVVRALLVEELSGRVQGGVRRLVAKRRAPDFRRAVLSVHSRNRERLLNKLLTEIADDL